jgi:fatty-acyl-CoA synthase
VIDPVAAGSEVSPPRDHVGGPSGGAAVAPPDLRSGDPPAAAARRFGEREALTFRGQRWSFREVDAEVDRLARGLIALGVAPGEKVCIWLVNCPAARRRLGGG